jgi:GNAT superfamily N-acetyltransferase
VTIEPFDPKTASEAELAAHHDLVAFIEREAVPDDEPYPFAEFAAYVRLEPPARKTWYWLAWDEKRERVLGLSSFMFWDEEANRNLGSFWVDVRTEERRNGLGSRLLAPVLQVARANGRTLLDAGTSTRVAAGAAFLQALGGRHVLTFRKNALDVDAVDLAMVHAWVDRAKQRAGDYRLDGWDAPCPEDRVEAFVAAQSIMNTAPTEDFSVEDEVFSVELLREREAANAARGYDQFVFAAVHEPTGEIAGYTEIVLPTKTWPTRGFQGDTGVDPRHREKGLGRWLKAAMLLRVIDERPEVRRIVTGNAGSNEPMLNINHALGFRCIDERPVFQISIEDIEARLAAR